MLRYFVYLSFFFTQTVFSFPISLSGDWYVKEGVHFNFSEAPETWEKQTKFPLSFKPQKNREYPNSLRLVFIMN